MPVLIFLLGIVTWTFTEYMLHRFLGHVHKGKNFFKKEHLQHHSKANYFAPAYKKALLGVAVSSVLFVVLSLISSPLIALSFIAGFVGMYGVYETVHFRYHSADPIAAPFIALRKHHFYHHFHNPKTNHGVTTRFWDRVFGTFRSVDTVAVPRKMVMPWLVADNKIKSAYQSHFRFSS